MYKAISETAGHFQYQPVLSLILTVYLFDISLFSHNTRDCQKQMTNKRNGCVKRSCLVRRLTRMTFRFIFRVVVVVVIADAADKMFR